jgi:hypothetical protein
MANFPRSVAVLWTPDDNVDFERRLRTCLAVSSKASTVYVVLNRYGSVKAIVSTKMRMKPISSVSTYIHATVWIKANKGRRVA